MAKSENIVLFEPQCWGFEHSSFNAALLVTVKLAFPSSRLYFCGEKEHITKVKALLSSNGFDDESVVWKNQAIFRRNALKWKRCFNDFSWCNTAINIARQVRAKLLVICSINNTSLLALKALMHLRQFNSSTIAIPHSCLADLLIQSWRPWNMKNALAFPPPENLRLIALGESIYKEAIQIQSKHQKQWLSLDHPYLWPDISTLRYEVDRRRIRFGFLGSANIGKGFDLFCKIADEIGPKYENADFLLAGFYYGFNTISPNSIFVKGVSDQPLSVVEFQRRANSMTYSVWLARPEHYRLTASATFIDSLAYLKPGIYLRNPFVEYYFNKMGDIGYLCDDFEQIVSTIKKILRDFPADRYKQQIKNIKNGRTIFEPNKLAERLHHILASLEIGQSNDKSFF